MLRNVSNCYMIFGVRVSLLLSYTYHWLRVFRLAHMPYGSNFEKSSQNENMKSHIENMENHIFAFVSLCVNLSRI